MNIAFEEIKTVKNAATVLKAGQSARTGITYEQDQLRAAIENLTLPMYGELNPTGEPQLNLAQISHRIDEVHIDEDGTVCVNIQLLNTPTGKVAKQLMESGSLEIAPCATGRVVDRDGIKTVNDYSIFTFNLREKQHA